MADQEYRFAGSSGKTTLYKFRPFQTNQHREWVREIFRDHKVFFPRASEINDPFDMSPRLEPITREGLIAGANDHWASHPEIPQKERARLLKYFEECDLDKHTADSQSRMRKRMEDAYAAFSLAGNRDHPMLWSHYAAGHTGLCVHFRADGDSIFGGSMGVIYTDTRPLVPCHMQSISDRELFQRIIFHKGKFWEYEEEYRFPRFPEAETTDFPMKFIGRFGHFPASALSGITVGARMPYDQIAAVKEIALNHTPKLPIWRAVETNSFAFAFERLAC